MSGQTEKMRRRQGGPMRGPFGMGGVVEKPRNFRDTWGKLIAYCSRYMPVIVVALVLAGVAAVFQIIGPDYLKEMTDEIMKGLPDMSGGVPISAAIDIGAVERIGFLLVIFYAVSALANFIQGYLLATVTQKVSRNMRTGISRKINKLPLRYFDKASFGDIMSRVTNDVDTIGLTMNQSIGTLIGALTMFFGAAIMMFLNSWILALTAIASSLIGFFLMFTIMQKSQKYFVQQQRDLGEANGHVEEVYSGHNIVKAYNGGKEARRVFERVNKTLCQRMEKSVHVRSDDAADAVHRQLRICGGLRGGGGPRHERNHQLWRHRRLHDIHPPVHPAPFPVCPGVSKPAANGRGQ